MAKNYDLSELRFRDLTASETEARVKQVTEKGCVLLIYKDARVDMNILDETVGMGNWQKDSQVVNGNLYGYLSIWDDSKKQWITKSACGVESNTEKEKGEDSDAFKRAGFVWGIGRELYTAPFIWVPSDKCQIVKEGNIFKCKTKFDIGELKIKDKVIVGLTIINKNTGEVVYSMNKPTEAPKQAVTEKPAPAKQEGQTQAAKPVPTKTSDKPTAKQLGRIKKEYSEAQIQKMLQKLGVDILDNVTKAQASQMISYAESR